VLEHGADAMRGLVDDGEGSDGLKKSRLAADN
jgi:hypothetical protein